MADEIDPRRLVPIPGTGALMDESGTIATVNGIRYKVFVTSMTGPVCPYAYMVSGEPEPVSDFSAALTLPFKRESSAWVKIVTNPPPPFFEFVSLVTRRVPMIDRDGHVEAPVAVMVRWSDGEHEVRLPEPVVLTLAQTPQQEWQMRVFAVLERDRAAIVQMLAKATNWRPSYAYAAGPFGDNTIVVDDKTEKGLRSFVISALLDWWWRHALQITDDNTPPEAVAELTRRMPLGARVAIELARSTRDAAREAGEAADKEGGHNAVRPVRPQEG